MWMKKNKNKIKKISLQFIDLETKSLSQKQVFSIDMILNKIINLSIIKKNVPWVKNLLYNLKNEQTNFKLEDQAFKK